MRINLRAVIPALLLGGLTAIPSFSTPVTGQANISSTVNVTQNTINFGNSFTPESPNTGDFVGLTGGRLKTLTGITTGNLPTPVMDFGTFNVAAGTIYFDLTNIAPGIGTQAGCTSAIGALCTPTGSPFTLIQQTPNSVEISLYLSGLAYLNSNMGNSSAAGFFTTQDVNVIKNTTVRDILLAVASTNGFTSSYSATFSAVPNTATPEPASLLLMGVGLLGAGVIARKRIRS